MTSPNPPQFECREVDGFMVCRSTLDSTQYGYKLATTGQYGMDVALPERLDIDEKNMSVWIPFASGVRRDGVGDLIEIGGIDTTRHRKLPNVLFDHGKDTKIPIAMAAERDEKGAYDYSRYTVVLDPISKVAKLNAFFYQGKGMAKIDRKNENEHALLCEQLYDMVAKKMLGAGSIGYQVIRAARLPANYETGTPQGLHLLETLMLEGSLVVMPCNMDTARKALDMPTCCGKPLSPVLVKSLEPYAPERKAVMGYEKGFIDELMADPEWNRGGDDLKTAKRKEAEAELAKISGEMRKIEAEIRDWNSRQYKPNTGRVQVGGEHGGDYSIGAVNEGKRARIVRGLERELAHLKQEESKFRSRVNAYKSLEGEKSCGCSEGKCHCTPAEETTMQAAGEGKKAAHRTNYKSLRQKYRKGYEPYATEYAGSGIGVRRGDAVRVVSGTFRGNEGVINFVNGSVSQVNWTQGTGAQGALVSWIRNELLEKKALPKTDVKALRAKYRKGLFNPKQEQTPPTQPVPRIRTTYDYLDKKGLRAKYRQKAINERIAQNLQPGEQVRLVDGPYKGQTATVVTPLTPKGKIKLSMGPGAEFEARTYEVGRIRQKSLSVKPRAKLIKGYTDFDISFDTSHMVSAKQMEFHKAMESAGFGKPVGGKWGEDGKTLLSPLKKSRFKACLGPEQNPAKMLSKAAAIAAAHGAKLLSTK